MIQQKKDQGLMANQAYLNGPEAVKDMLIRMKEVARIAGLTLGTKLMAFNNDLPNYDATQRAQHGQMVYDALEPLVPRARDKKILADMISISLIREL